MMTHQRWRTFVIEDHPLMRDALVHMVTKEPDFEVVGKEVPSDLGVLEAARPDLVLLDVQLTDPYPDGFAVLKKIRVRYPGWKVVIFSAHEMYREGAAKLGAHAFVIKTEPPATILAILRRVMRGEPGPAEDNGDPEAMAKVMSLTKAEAKVGYLLAVEGLSVDEIAQRLGIVSYTVRDHKKNLFAKLGVHTIANAVRVLLAGGIRWPT